uniref:Uncharacterized protein n=1 Tax=Arundo donax TaxID=35708 RepID=A0A0A9FB73_ARUDO
MLLLVLLSILTCVFWWCLQSNSISYLEYACQLEDNFDCQKKVFLVKVCCAMTIIRTPATNPR